MPSLTPPHQDPNVHTNKAACCVLQGRILMTHPTKAIIGTLLKDFVKISSGRAQQGGQQVRDLLRAFSPGACSGACDCEDLAVLSHSSKSGSTSQHMQHTCCCEAT